MNLDDATLARLATEAGLCFAQCWDIDLYLSAEGQQDNAEWVCSAPSVPERRLRQNVADYSNHCAQNALSKLRRFAELLNDAVKAAGGDYEVASDETMRRIRSTTKRYRVRMTFSTNDGCIDNRLGAAIWGVLDTEKEILESMSLPELLPPCLDQTISAT